MPIELDAADVEQTPEVERPAAEQAEPWDDEIFSGPDEEPHGDGQLLGERQPKVKTSNDVFIDRLRTGWRMWHLAGNDMDAKADAAECAKSKATECKQIMHNILDELLLADDTPAADVPRGELPSDPLNLPEGIRRVLKNNFHTFADFEAYLRGNGSPVELLVKLKGIGKKKAAIIEAEYQRILGERNE